MEELKFLLFILNLSVNDNSFEGSMLSGHLQCTSSCNLPSTTDRLKDEIGPPMVGQSANVRSRNVVQLDLVIESDAFNIGWGTLWKGNAQITL